MNDRAIAVTLQAHLHHQYFLGLQLMVTMEHGRTVVGDWMFRLFRQQHLDKFLSSFQKLGLDKLPHAVACARYHALSNGVGGVRVEYMEESDRKAWVRFRYPRWLYDGAAICGIPVEASRGFLKGWYAYNGVSLNNPRLGYVCVSEDLTGQYGLCGYFREYDHDLADDQRLQFAPHQMPPPFDAAKQPVPPAEHWNEQRLAKAARNYAMEYCRNGLRELIGVIGREPALEIGKRAARLTGLQQYRHLASAINAIDGNAIDAGHFLATLFNGMGDVTELVPNRSANSTTLQHAAPRFVRDIDATHRNDLLACWIELWRGAVSAQREFIDVDVQYRGDGLVWHLHPRRG